MLNVLYAKSVKYALYAECHYAECRYAECLGAGVNSRNIQLVQLLENWCSQLAVLVEYELFDVTLMISLSRGSYWDGSTSFRPKAFDRKTFGLHAFV
jgi:hypothetical protein